MLKKSFIQLRTAGRAIKKATRAVLIILAELFYSLGITYFVAKWAIAYAYSVRGYEAYGGEYILIFIAFGFSFGSIHVFFRSLREEGCL